MQFKLNRPSGRAIAIVSLAFAFVFVSGTAFAGLDFSSTGIAIDSSPSEAINYADKFVVGSNGEVTSSGGFFASSITGIGDDVWGMFSSTVVPSADVAYAIEGDSHVTGTGGSGRGVAGFANVNGAAVNAAELTSLYAYSPFIGPGATATNVFGLLIEDMSGLTASGNNHAINYADKFVVDALGNIQVGAINTAAPAGAACDNASETGKVFWDSTNDNVYICSGVSGWRKLTTSAP